MCKPTNTVLKIFSIISLVLLGYSQGRSQPVEPLKYEEVINLTLINNKNIEYYKYKVDEAKGDIISGKAKFNTTFDGSINKQYSLIPNTYDIRNGLNGQRASSYYTNEYIDYSINITKTIPLGTEINPGISLMSFGSDSTYNQINNSGVAGLNTSRATVYLNIRQPLFKGLGPGYHLYDYHVAESMFKINELNYYYEISVSLRSSLLAYLSYIYGKIYLNIQSETIKRYLTLQEQLCYLAEMDAIPKADLTYVNALISTQKSSIKEAELNFYISKEQLGIVMGLDPSKSQEIANPPDAFIIEHVELPLNADYIEKCTAQIVNKRFDVMVLENQLDLNKQTIKQINSQKKQELDLNLGIGYNGIFESNTFENYYQPFINNIPGLNYKIGLSYLINPKNSKEKGELVKAIAQQDQIKTNQEKVQFEESAQIRNSFQKITIYNEMVANNNEVIHFMKEALDNEYTKLKLGSSTVINLVQLQIEYNKLLINQYKTILDLNQSIINFRFLSGTLVQVEENKILKIDYQNLFVLPFLN